MGLQPILDQLHSFQLELCPKRYRSVDSALRLTLGVNGPKGSTVLKIKGSMEQVLKKSLYSMILPR